MTICRPRPRSRRAFAVALALFTATPVLADEALPDPLTLEFALAQALSSAPELARDQAHYRLAAADVQSQDASDDWDVSLNARAQWIGPSDLAADQDHDDHKLSLNADKLLYDFGRSGGRSAAARARLQQSRWTLIDRVAQQRIVIMQRYFDVLLADLQHVADTEAMTVAFLDFDRLRERSALGQVSDIELLQAQVSYEELLARRAATEHRQRAARALLAIAIAHPDELSPNLAPPDAPDYEQPLPEYPTLVAQALAANPRLAALRERLQASAELVAAARAESRPTLRAGAEVAAYSREETGSDDWQLRLNLRVPLYTGTRTPAGIAGAQAERQLALAELASYEQTLRQSVLELWQEIGLLRQRRREARVREDYRDLYLDRSRALYERSVRADLGDAMAEYSAARVLSARVQFAHVLAWERLRALLGARNDTIIAALRKQGYLDQGYLDE